MITEGKVKLKVETKKIVSKEMEVFYNPVMKFNRDISVLLLSCLESEFRIGLPLSGSGIRAIRFLLELNKKVVKEISINYYSKNAIKNIKSNLRLNKINPGKKIIISNKDANLFMLESCGFDYIDIDPFGSPNMFLDSAVKRISRKGILAITATDTAPLCGTYPKACLRKYWAKPLLNENMHEIGLRILIRKVQLIGAQFDKALIPIFSYSKDHYLRVFFRAVKGKQEVDKIMKQHDYFNEAGPMWLGNLEDSKLAAKMSKKNDIEENQKFLNVISSESKVNVVGFYDIHAISKRNKTKQLPKIEDIIKKLKAKGNKASRTHFSGTGIRSNAKLNQIVNLLRF